MKKLVISFVMLAVTSLAANAHVDTGHMKTKQYMLNTGYSSEMAKYGELATRDPYAPIDDKYPQKSPKRFLKYVWKRIDSTSFPDDNNTWHDIQMSTGFSDLN